MASPDSPEKELLPSPSPSCPVPPPSYLNTVTQVCSISMNMTDRIRAIGVPPEIILNLREVIITSWGRIQGERDYYGSHEYKLAGNPWNGNGSDAVRSRRLMASVLNCMAKHGWNLLQSADVSKKEMDKDTLFFELGLRDPEAHIFCLSFNMSDRLRIIDVPGLLPCLKEAVLTAWSPGLQSEREYFGSLELKLWGNPWWTASGSQIVGARILLCQIIANFRGAGYKLYGSIDMSIGDAKGRDLETWFFRKVGNCWH